jgi:hypothetical protein
VRRPSTQIIRRSVESWRSLPPRSREERAIVRKMLGEFEETQLTLKMFERPRFVDRDLRLTSRAGRRQTHNPRPAHSNNRTSPPLNDSKFPWLDEL